MEKKFQKIIWSKMAICYLIRLLLLKKFVLKSSQVSIKGFWSETLIDGNLGEPISLSQEVRRKFS